MGFGCLVRAKTFKMMNIEDGQTTYSDLLCGSRASFEFSLSRTGNSSEGDVPYRAQACQGHEGVAESEHCRL